MKLFWLFLRQNRRICWIGGSIVAVTLVGLVVVVSLDQVAKQANLAAKQAKLSKSQIRDLTTHLEVEILLEQDELEKLEQQSAQLVKDQGSTIHVDAERQRIQERIQDLTAHLVQLGELRAKSRPMAGPPDVAARVAKKALSERKGTLEALPKGNITLRAPASMKVSDKRIVEAEVGFNIPNSVDRTPPPGTKTVERTLHISPEMVAALEGAGFEIKPITPEQQPIAEGFPTAWRWNVEAKESGEQELRATLYALVGDKAERYAIASYRQTISVSVREQTWGEWLDSLGHEIGTLQGIFVALGAIATPVLAWFGLRRRGKSTAEST
jgi:hypothetical protein